MATRTFWELHVRILSIVLILACADGCGAKPDPQFQAFDRTVRNLAKIGGNPTDAFKQLEAAGFECGKSEKAIYVAHRPNRSGRITASYHGIISQDTGGKISDVKTETIFTGP